MIHCDMIQRIVRRNRMIPLKRLQVATEMIALVFVGTLIRVEAFVVSPPFGLQGYGIHRSKTAILSGLDDNYSISSLSVNESKDISAGDIMNTMDWDVVEDDDDDTELEIDPDTSDEDLTTVETFESSEVHDIFQKWLSIREEELSLPSSPKVAVIPLLFDSMEEWSVTMYNPLLQSISRYGSVRDAEALLYYMIQQQQCVTDESFYHVFSAYHYHYKQKHSNKRNRRKWGTAFKVEQLLALQDALVGCEPSARTLQVVLRAMAEDRTDVRVALRARRIWDRLLTLSDAEATSVSSVISVLQACAHVPSEVAADEKLAAFTIALDVFNGATKESHCEPQPGFYLWFLRACRTLLADTAERKRDAVVEAAFRRACTAGVVSPAVLKALSDVASDSCILRLLGGFIEDGFDPPVEWSRKCALTRSATS